MYFFTNLMALFWTLSEGLILICLKWGFMSLKGAEKREKPFLVFFAIFIGSLSLLIFGGENFFGRYMDLERRLNLTAYRWALWNFLCTLWVVLEGIIMVYVLRIYKTLKRCHTKSELGSDQRITAVSRFPWGIPFLILIFFAFYVFYEYNLLSIMAETGLNGRGIYRMSVFYVRVCGLFWILFEWVVACLGIKTYFILKRKAEASQ